MKLQSIGTLEEISDVSRLYLPFSSFAVLRFLAAVLRIFLLLNKNVQFFLSVLDSASSIFVL